MSPKKTQKPPEIIEFDEVFRKHVTNKFTRGRWIFDDLNHRLHRKNPKSPFVLVIGEAGIGKTALMANYLADKKDQVVHYFLEDKKRDRLNPVKFAKHLYASLSWIHGWSDVQEIRSYRDDALEPPLELLRRRIEEISRDKLATGKHQAIVVDGLDESRGEYQRNLSIIDLLRGIDFPDNIKVILSSRKIPELDELHFQETGKSNVVLITGRDDENLKDVEKYLLANLSPEGVNAKDLELVINKSDGNFQYATLIIDMIEKGETSVETILKQPPDGLSEIYDWKLQKISERIKDKDTLEKIWKVMRIISLLLEPHTPQLICEILEIDDPRYKQNIFGPLEQFFDLAVYAGGRGKCRWYHNSLHEYVRKRFSSSQFYGAYKQTALYVRACIEGTRGMELPPGLLHYLDWYYVTKNYLEVVKLGQLYLRQFFTEPASNIRSIPFLFLLTCQSAAIRAKNLRAIIFFGMVLFCHELILKGPEGNGIKPGSPDWGGQMIDEETLRSRVQRGDTTKRVVCRMQKFFLKDTKKGPADEAPIIMIGLGLWRFLNGEIDEYDIQLYLKSAFYNIRTMLNKESGVYDLCEKYINEWFPTLEKEIAEMQMVSRTSAKADKDSKKPPIVAKTTYPDSVTVILNGSSESMERSEIEDYRKNGSSKFTLMIDKLKRKVWFYKDKVAIKGVGYELLCLLASHPPGTVLEYEQIWDLLWKVPDPGDLKNTRDRVQKVLYRNIWPKHERLKEHIMIDPGVGVKITEGNTILLIPHSID